MEKILYRSSDDVLSIQDGESQWSLKLIGFMKILCIVHGILVLTPLARNVCLRG